MNAVGGERTFRARRDSAAVYSLASMRTGIERYACRKHDFKRTGSPTRPSCSTPRQVWGRFASSATASVSVTLIWTRTG